MKLLLADCNPARSQALADALVGTKLGEILRIDAVQALPDAAQKYAPDLIVLAIRRLDPNVIDTLRSLISRAPQALVVVVDEHDPALMDEAIRAGVSSYIVVGAQLPDLQPVAQAARAFFRRTEEIHEKLHKAEIGLKERATIERAKSKLMHERRLTEPEAYHLLRRKAMDCGRRIVDIATDVLADTTKHR